jgi:Ca2+-binding RTX toxin-like protein
MHKMMKPRPQCGAKVPLFEPLETRQLMSATLTLLRPLPAPTILSAIKLGTLATSGDVTFNAGSATLTITASYADAIDVEQLTAEGVGFNGGTVHELIVKENGVTTYTGPAFAIHAIDVIGSSGDDQVLLNTSIPASVYGGAGNDIVFGGTGSDYIEGGDGNDSLYGYLGNDSIFGGAGNDSISGEAGNDFLDGGTGADDISGGDGIDTVSYASRTANLNISLDDLANDGDVGGKSVKSFTGGIALSPAENDNVHSDIEVVIAGSGNDVITTSRFDPVARQFYGGAGNDSLTGGAGSDLLDGGTGDDVLYGNAGNDSLYGEDGNDSLFGGAGADYLSGGNGDDVLVDVGGGQSDCLAGGLGLDNFWCDAEPTEVVADASAAETVTFAVHRVASFMTEHINRNGTTITQPVSRELLGQNFIDPGDGMNYRSFSNQPLFAPGGPSKDDIFQGNTGNCWYLATLSAIAKTDPTLIRNSVVNLGDGTYAVMFCRGGSSVFVRVDGDLPTDGAGNLTYAGLGTGGSNWVAVMEKALTFFRADQGTYASIAGGFPGEAFQSFGRTYTDVGNWGAGAAALLNYIRDELARGKAVTYFSHNVPAGCPCINNHAYMVDHVNLDASGNAVQLVLRNPWGYDGAGNDGNTSDGYVTLTGPQALAAFWGVHSAYV